MIRALAMMIALLCAEGPTHHAATCLVSCCGRACSLPCDGYAPAPPPEPVSCGCEGATVLPGQQVAPQAKPAAELISPLPAATPPAETSAPLEPVPVAPVAKPELPPVTPAAEAQPSATQPPATQPSATPPAGPSTTPGEQPTAPAVEPEPSTPQPITPSEEPSAPTEQPVEQPAAQRPPTTPVEEIFGEGSAPAARERSAADAAPAEEVAPATKTPPEVPAADAAPANQPSEPSPSEAPKADELFDFGMEPSAPSEPGATSKPGVWASGEARTWNDATGRHACEARLAGVTAEGVVLARIDGDTVRVPYRLLSVDDLRFVRRQIEIRRTQLAQAHETIVVSRSP
jgi:hypothetical protein